MLPERKLARIIDRKQASLRLYGCLLQIVAEGRHKTPKGPLSGIRLRVLTHEAKGKYKPHQGERECARRCRQLIRAEIKRDLQMAA